MTLSFQRRQAAVALQTEAHTGVKRLGLAVYLRTLYDVPSGERLPVERLRALTEYAEAYDAQRAVAEAEEARVGSLFSPLHEYLARLKALPQIEREPREKAARAVAAKRAADDSDRQAEHAKRAAENQARGAAERAAREAREQSGALDLDTLSDAYWDAHPDVEELTDAHVFDAQGEPYPGASPTNLKDLAGMLRPGLVMSRQTLNHWGRVRRWHEARGGQWPTELPADYQDRPAYLSRNWALTHDRETIVPPGLKGARLQAWAVQWRDRAIGDTEAIVFAVPGEHLTFVTWWDEPTTGVEWAKKLSGGVAWDDGARYQAQGYDAYRVPCPPLYLPSAYLESDTADAAAVFAALSSARLVTGWAALDNLFRGKPGVPMGGRVLVKGDPKHGKSAVAIGLARAAMSQGLCVAWRAEDESVADVMTRRLQQIGLSPREALEPSPEALARLSAQPFLMTDRGTLEDFWESAHEWAAGRPLVMVADSLQTVPSAAAEGKGEREALEATIKAVIDCQKKWPAIFVATSEITGSARTPKGSGRIAYSFTTLLDVRRAGAIVSVAVGPSRHNAEGRFDLALDFGRQRLLEPAAVAKAAANAELRADILSAVAEIGGTVPRSKLEGRLTVGADRLRVELGAMVDDGVLTRAAKGYQLPQLQ